MGGESNARPKAKAKAEASAEELKQKARDRRLAAQDHENAMQRLRTSSAVEIATPPAWGFVRNPDRRAIPDRRAPNPRPPRGPG